MIFTQLFLNQSPYFLALSRILNPGTISRPFFSHLMEAAGFPSLAALHLSFRLPLWSTTKLLPPGPTTDGVRWGTSGGDAEEGFTRLCTADFRYCDYWSRAKR